jgi:hypothetical protein
MRKPPLSSGAERSKTPMLSRPRKPPWKMFRPLASVDLEDAPGSPGVDRRVDVAEVPLVGR